ncbi:hypothetical protein HZS38_18445 [Xenorhabdus nematophila]|uniref:Uncharacterized protein n=1 Tax=Xenorhabdus nematophila (strain ATCC 19061 / DSM 3370 / CCUG 14189 / LMG 1036 / NCIMB 9965 / AN6) TaxID=406817 RepID=D3VBM7_XENNA|nr:hypothetical protein [Xenorhabdus nematophila]CEE90605.1 hypothetical protein XNA1_1650002 [Xenorhabdus nematophila str. Anatoliense]CEF28823.1 hypothetical protein XNW1_1410002 [Xenorhabdus nematophila str. Websteri]MBA0021018.1 hypothetical protein [Xenorhabdus nematophila]QNJ36658.1 hypothetical protein H8F46_18780 [Xenorhabdus nematophila]CBJ91866.1 hypothetical protein XNC1_3835 [Xenorhabdus nematophila ATCC 19061]
MKKRSDTPYIAARIGRQFMAVFAKLNKILPLIVRLIRNKQNKKLQNH